MLKNVSFAFIAVVISLTLIGGCSGSSNNTDDITPPDGGNNTILYGFTAFPYDITLEAIDTVHGIILPNSNLYAIHYDRCIPWLEALNDTEFSEWIVDDWNNTKNRIPNTHAVYLAIAPTAQDRISLAPNCGPGGEDHIQPFPPQFAGATFNNDAVKQAYLNYVRRAVEHFKPSYLNIGVEISEMSIATPEQWSDFEELYDFTFTAIKNEYPELQISVSFVLQSLLLERVADQVKPLLERSDYIGLSFYPYGSEFGEAQGTPPLPNTIPEQWRDPLDFVLNYTDKPIAITETGYTTKDIFLSEVGINFPGNEELQGIYVKDLVNISKSNKYLFVVWFVPVDYEKLLERIPGHPEVFLIWRNAGLYDENVEPKPAFEAWQNFKD